MQDKSSPGHKWSSQMHSFAGPHHLLSVKFCLANPIVLFSATKAQSYKLGP